MQHATMLLDEAEPLPLPPPPKPPRFARGSIAPPAMFDAEIIGVRVLEHPAPAEWGPFERVTLRDRVDRIALSLVCGLGTMAALLAVALLA